MFDNLYNWYDDHYDWLEYAKNAAFILLPIGAFCWVMFSYASP